MAQNRTRRLSRILTSTALLAGLLAAAPSAAASGNVFSGGALACGSTGTNVAVAAGHPTVYLGISPAITEIVSTRNHYYEWTGRSWTYKGASGWSWSITERNNNNFFTDASGKSSDRVYNYFPDGIRGTTYYAVQHEVYFHGTWREPARTMWIPGVNQAAC